MATYKKRGYKNTNTANNSNSAEADSATAEVFEKLDSTASKTEEWVSKYQNFILVGIGTIAISVLSYLAYQKFVSEPKELEAVSELNQAQYYFDLAVNGQNSDSLFLRALIRLSLILLSILSKTIVELLLPNWRLTVLEWLT